jgi:PAS domain S-box-containing protein
VAEIGYAGSANIQLALGVAALTVIILFMALLASAQTLARQRGELIEADPNGVLVVDSHGRIETVNGRLTKLFGYRQDELLGQPVEMLLPQRHRRSHVAFRAGYSASPANRPMGAGRDLQGLCKNGNEFPIEIGLSPITTERGVAVVATVIDITQRKAAEEKERILIRELQHRTNNLLAVIQAIAHQSLSGPGSIEQMRSAFDARLQALSRAHRQLVNSSWRGVALKEIVRSTLEPFGTRIDIDGSDIIFGAKETQDFSLVIHELATNAVKHGALSDANGKIKIGWGVDGNDGDAVLRFQWQERGGPPVDAPKRQGFGTSLLRAAFSDINIDYAREGLTCEIRVPFGKIEFTSSAPSVSDHQAVKAPSL